MEEALAILKQVGLNQYEAKVYTALLSKGSCSAGEISESTDVPRSRVYDVLISLEKKGFAIIQMGKPVKYLPVTPKDVITRLKTQYKKEYEKDLEKLQKLEGEIMSVLVPLHNKVAGVEPNEPSLVRGENIPKHMEQMISEAKKSICKVTTGNGFIRISEKHTAHLANAKKRGVKIKFLASLAEEHKPKAKELKELSQIKHLKGIKGRFLVKDGNEALLMMSPEHSDQDMGIWVKSPYLAESLQHIFDHLWAKGEEI